MNTSPTKARLTTRTAAMAACLAALFAGATACGTEDGTASARTATSIDQLDSAKANQSEYLQRLHAQAEAARQARAERADAARWQHGYPGADAQSQGYGDDRRQPTGQAQHPPGYNKALPNQQ